MNIVVFNVKFSENLGDGVLAECLEQALSASVRGAHVETVDLAGRTDYGETSGSRGRVLGLLHAMPARLRPHAIRAGLRGKLAALAPLWQRKIAAADAVAIGGGNLFQDDDLNFPLKVGQVLELAAQAGKPLAIYGVGVTGHWSRRALRLFSAVRGTNLVHLSVRDAQARKNWLSHFPDLDPHIVPDPGLMAEMLHPRAARAPSARPMIGLCVTSPLVLARHSQSFFPLSRPSEYAGLAVLLVRRGYAVRFFTNGAREDQDFATGIMSHPDLAGPIAEGSVQLLGRPETPNGLVSTIATLDAVAAHRLHACIVAQALRIPSVGLDWDGKVGAFFEAAGRQDFFVRGQATPAMLDALLHAAVGGGIDRQRAAANVRQARDAANAMAHGVEAAVNLARKRAEMAPNRNGSLAMVTTSFG